MNSHYICAHVCVYLGRGVFRGTKEKPFLHKPMEPTVPKTKLVKDDDYILQGCMNRNLQEGHTQDPWGHPSY